MASMRLIKPGKEYAGHSLGWWLKNYWEYVYPRTLTTQEASSRTAEEGQDGPVMYAVGKYAHRLDDPQRLAKLENSKSDNIEIERYHMTHTIRRGFVLPFVKFIALESDGDGSSFDELRNVAKKLADKSDVEIRFKVDANLKEGDKQIDSNHEIKIDKNNSMDYYCESDDINLPAPLHEQRGDTGTQTNKAVSSAYMAIFEPQEEGTYRIDVTAKYHFDYQEGKDYSNLHDIYEIVVGSPR
jgi:hypothetical protein